MFRKALLFVTAVTLVAGVIYRVRVGRAGDEVIAAPKGEQPAQEPIPEGPKSDPKEKPPEKLDIDKIKKLPPPILDVDPNLANPAPPKKESENSDDIKIFGHPGDKPALEERKPPKGAGPRSDGPGSGGEVQGFGPRGSGNRQKMLASGGGNEQSERAVTAALQWLARHQEQDGHWGLANYQQRCKDKTCTGASQIPADAGATAMGLLPFLAAGQTHKAKGPYKDCVGKGVHWLIRNQQPDGNLAKGAQQMMYSHGLATIALCEGYALTADKEVGMRAQAAVNFILAAQNSADGGWRYNPKDPGDTSVVGWQLMALKAAHQAGLDVGGSVFSGTGKWLDSVAVHEGSEYAYQPGQGSAPTMTAEGLLCRQYLGAKRDNPMLSGGTKYLLEHLPDEGFPNIYYWYHATQVLHNMGGTPWNTWNGKMRDLLIRAQSADATTCAYGSWAPEKDAWGRHGGRLMMTSLSALTLEIYYRYVPLYKADGGK